MMNEQHLILLSLTSCFCGLLCTLDRMPKSSFYCMAAGALACFLGFFLRYYQAFPMIPMYISLHGTLSLLVFLWLIMSRRYGTAGLNRREGVFLQGLIVLLGLVLIIFPKDFYLPFIRSISIWSHLFLLTTIAAKATLFIASIKGFVFLAGGNKKGGKTPGSGLAPAMLWSLWGFVFLTLSMFSGELWSYLGWGTPVVWHDPVIATGMALWFYWTAFLHLHYTRNWSSRGRALFMAVGGLLLLFSCWPDMGPYRPIFKGLPWS